MPCVKAAAPRIVCGSAGGDDDFGAAGGGGVVGGGEGGGGGGGGGGAVTAAAFESAEALPPAFVAVTWQLHVRAGVGVGHGVRARRGTRDRRAVAQPLEA